MATVTGACGLEACSSEGSTCSSVAQTACGINGCGGCGHFGSWASYGHYNGCGSVACNRNTGLPLIPMSCGGLIEFVQNCSPSGEVFATLDECGPDPGLFANEPLCGLNEQLIACVNPYAFAALCSGACNPCVIGVHRVTIVY